MHAPPLPELRSRKTLWWTLAVPFAYFFMTRVPGVRQRVGWLFSYVVPVLALAWIAHGGSAGMLIAAATMIAVYAAYEFGYIVNDAWTVAREAMPTLRLGAEDRAWYRTRLPHAAAIRFAVGSLCLAAAMLAGAQHALATALVWLALWPLFAAYNWWRGRITIALYLGLGAIRFVLPIWASADMGGAAPHALWLLLLYPLPNTYVAAWKPRYGLQALQRPFGGEQRFRLLWHGALAGLALPTALLVDRRGAWVFAAAAAYYFVIRIIAARRARSR